MLGALVAANRVPALEKYAFERNGSCYTLFVLLMLAPVDSLPHAADSDVCFGDARLWE